MPKVRRQTGNARKGGAANRKIVAPLEQERLALLHGPYTPRATRVGRQITCLLRGKAKVWGWSNGLIPWPLIRVGHGGSGAYAITSELARAIRFESCGTIVHWWGAGVATATQWRRKFGIKQFNEGTQRLYSLWKEPKLPKGDFVKYSGAAMKQRRLAKGMTSRQVAQAMGWNDQSNYSQMERGARRSTRPGTLKRLAKVLGCRTEDLSLDAAVREGRERPTSL